MKNFVNGYCSIVKKVCYYVCFISMAMVACMMVLMFVDAMLGLIFNSRITGSYEIVQMMLCVLVFTSWAYTQTERGHIHVVLFIRMLPHKLRFICYSITSILSTVTIGVGTYGVFKSVLDYLESGEATGTLLIPQWPFVAVECLAFAALTIALLGDTLKSITAIFNKEVAEDVMSSWT
ncbi:MAG: TRAP transporter small permease [Oscillospiraceae bacterium]